MHDDTMAFLQHVFPQPLPGYPNPDLSPEVQAILAQLAKLTSLPLSYLEGAASLAIQGIAGLPCLWHLHGKTGTLEVKTSFVRVPQWLRDEWDYWAIGYVERRGLLKLTRVSLDWVNGHIMWNEVAPGGIQRPRDVRIGKWIGDLEVDEETKALYKKAYDERALLHHTWNWAVSAHPVDILTMSWGRSWKSCASPGGEAALAPFTDLAAGSALLFFYLPGNERPSGRLILRPYLDDAGNPGICIAPKVKGMGPWSLNATDEPAVQQLLGGGDVRSICERGRAKRALTRYIHDDYGGGSICKQSDAAYAEAYARLGNVKWPRPKLRSITLRHLVTPAILKEYADLSVCPPDSVIAMVASRERLAGIPRAALKREWELLQSGELSLRKYIGYPGVSLEFTQVVLSRLAPQDIIKIMKRVKVLVKRALDARGPL